MERTPGPEGAAFVDSSIVLTAGARIGQAFAPRILELLARSGLPGVTDALALQEVYDFAPSPLGDLFRAVVDEVLEVTAEDWTAASALERRMPGRPPRVYLHAAVMRRRRVERLYAVAGAGFQDLPGLRPLPVADLLEPQD